MDVTYRGSANYPAALIDLPQPPEQIFSIGGASLWNGRLVSIVGTRNPSPYGIRTARSIASSLAIGGATIVSGMARGIDAVAHRAALDAGRPTIAVLGTGVDVPYPAAHRDLHRVIGESGLVVSEFGTGARAHKGSFPRRNRIIAALAPITIVVEAGHKSGALNTASHALDLNRVVAAVPGPIDSPQSEGTNQLIRDGAMVIASVDDAMSLAGFTRVTRSEPMGISADEGVIWRALGTDTQGVDALAMNSGLSTRDCLTLITRLELRGLVECLLTGEVRRR